MNDVELEYVGFWLRVGAAIIDTILMLVVIVPVLTWIYGPGYWVSEKYIHGTADVLLNWVLPAIAVILF